MKTLTKILEEKPCLFNSDIPDRVKEFLEEYRLSVQQADGTPDIKEWIYMTLDELEAALLPSPVQ